MDDRDDEDFEAEEDLFAQDGPDLFGDDFPASPGVHESFYSAPGDQPAVADLPDEPDVDDLPDDADLDDLPAPGVSGSEATGAPAAPQRRHGDDVEITESLVEVVAAIRSGSRPNAPLALYRRYRPDTFAEMIGQDHVTEPLQRALLNNRVNHAYLFSGPRGCGKTTSARILARALNCEQGPLPVPCGECQSCRDLARGGPGSIDVIEIDAASHGGVDDARDLRERAFFAPVHSRYKIYIVDEAHMVTTAGFNALLKVVEEPPPHVKFIFATTEPDKVIGTIRSRTHHYPFRLVPPKTLSNYLGELCAAEGVVVEPTVLPLVVRAGAGSVRDSLSVLDQLLGGAGESGVTYPQATALLGYTPDALLDDMVDAFAAGDAHGVFAGVDKVIEVGQDPRRFAEDLLRRLRDLIIVAAVPDALSSGLVDVSADQAERFTTQAARLGPGELTRAAEVIARGLTDMRGTTAPRLHLELMCARVLLPGADVDDRGLHARLDRLERRIGIESAGSAGDGATSEGRRRDPQPQAEQTRPASVVPSSPAPVAAAADPRPEAQPPAQRVGASASASEAQPTSPPDRPDAATRPSTTIEPRPSAEPSPSETEPTPAVSAPPAAQDASASSAPRAVGGLGTADLRRMWPDVLAEVKARRRFTWILLSQNAQVLELAADVLTLGMANAGARDSFGRGGSEDVLREAILAVAGIAVRVQPVLDPTATPPPVPTTAAPAPQPTPASGPSPADIARAALRAPAADDEQPGAEPTRDDADVIESAEAHDELLARHLGAELIAEEDVPT